MEHIYKEYSDRFKCWVITTDEGYMITHINSIEPYMSFKQIFCSTEEDTNYFKAITIEEDNKNKKDALNGTV